MDGASPKQADLIPRKARSPPNRWCPCPNPLPSLPLQLTETSSHSQRRLQRIPSLEQTPTCRRRGR